jgi:benzaldehyde dehydrogenase (NAD)
MATAGLAEVCPMDVFEPTTWTGRIFLCGWQRGQGGERDVIAPATGQILGRVGVASPSDVSAAVDRGIAAQRAWAAVPYDEKAAILRKAGDLFAAHGEAIQWWIARELGSILGGFETGFVSKACYEAAGLCSLPFGDILRTPQAKMSFSRRVPVGVVGVIAPFNAPLVLSVRAVAPALALGNAVVLKPDLRAAVCGGVLIARIFEQAGIPEGLLCVLPGAADVGEALVTEPRVPVVAFTGSTRAGRAIVRAAAESLKRVHLELGGKSSLIVLDDAELDKAVSLGAWGAFLHQGQICMAAGRQLVHRSLYESYLKKLAEKAEHLPVGDPAKGHVALGPIIDAQQRDRIHSIVSTTVGAGARLMAGGTYDGLFYKPTVLADVPRDSTAFREEIFGPVAVVVPFDSVEEAIELARDTEYGLSLGIVTRDVMKGLAIAERIPSGCVHINDQTVADEVVNPFGGVKASGGGSRLGGAHANFEAFTETQWVTMRSEPPHYPF